MPFLLLLSCSKKTDIDTYFQSIKKDSLKLNKFMAALPKGGDLHNHSSGSVYAEDYIDVALKDSLFIDTTTYLLSKVRNSNPNFIYINDLIKNSPNKRDSIINYWSVRDYHKRGLDGHDQFFSTFAKFFPAYIGNESYLLSTLCKRASEQNISYLETMIRVDHIMDSVANHISPTSWKDDFTDEQNMDLLYKYFKEFGLGNLVNQNVEELQKIYDETEKHGVELNFNTYGLRVLPNQALIFLRLLISFESADRLDILKGVNFVAPEDNELALFNYDLHMKMFGYLSEKYPNVKVTLHAGEITKDLPGVSNLDLEDHIASAILVGGADRIGHGVDIAEENDYENTLKLMQDRGVAVEINLESNEVILDRNPENHPLKLYLENEIPICISTDDEGVLRSNLTNQYMLLIKYLPDIKYSELKELVFNSIEYSFCSQIQKDKLRKDLTKRFDIFESEVSKN